MSLPNGRRRRLPGQVLGAFGGIIEEKVELLEEVMLLDAERAFEEACEVAQNSAFTSTLGQERKSDEVDHQRRGQDGIGALPGELQAHFHAKEPLEMDEVPRG